MFESVNLFDSLTPVIFGLLGIGLAVFLDVKSGHNPFVQEDSKAETSEEYRRAKERLKTRIIDDVGGFIGISLEILSVIVPLVIFMFLILLLAKIFGTN